MIPAERKKYNQSFSGDKYKEYLQGLDDLYPTQLDFRIAESPVYVPAGFEEKMLSACESIIDTISTPEYLAKSERAIPAHLRVPGQDEFPHFIAFDFGVCVNEQGDYEPQLIEMQGFPSLFAWEVLLPEVHEEVFGLHEGYSVYGPQFNRESYIQVLKEIIIGHEDPANVILLEIFPHQQKTRVDFYATETLLQIRPVCITELIKEGKQVYYMRDGVKTPVKRIYNRVIFDDLFRQPKEVQEKGKIFQEELDVTWIPHPNWFYRISKYTLPFINHPYVPHTRFLNEGTLPTDLQNYVVKPLFSFAGQGVIIDVTAEEIQKISDPENWIIQKKVSYASAIETPGEPAKVEIRMFYFQAPGQSRPVAANNLARLSKGKMIGVRYNKDKDWVGGSFCLFER